MERAFKNLNKKILELGVIFLLNIFKISFRKHCIFEVKKYIRFESL